MKVVKFGFLFVLMLLLSGDKCLDYDLIRGSGDIETEEREIRGVDGVELATIGHLHIKIGSEEKLQIEAEDNILPHIETYVRGGVLIIETERGVQLRPRRSIHYYLTVKELDSIANTSSGQIEAPDLEAKSFYIKCSSSGSIEVGGLDANIVEIRLSSSGGVDLDDVRAEELEVGISSSGSLEIAGGEVEEQDVTLTSSGSYRARRLRSDDARVRISSSGSAYVYVNEYLRASTSSSGSIYYYGDPEVDKHETSSGRVRRR